MAEDLRWTTQTGLYGSNGQILKRILVESRYTRGYLSRIYVGWPTEETSEGMDPPIACQNSPRRQ
ncbi:hypothetical protein ELG72_37275 [Rhizobium leguminosarum]|uniref:hypothetical protein n=1 Tax=Rhizobium TaxID=379 RepID=UPI001030F011|nr:hypothetical protein [Rhizobium leguminosarum]TBF87498.1 hypothetical protein ELG82_38015 [Rhizobium leguminosarum]TBG06974.1 hypothetical protein ELG80_37790 [Rhizobium leguminosarum]TBG07845.1 hypothetical protein ELG81_37175 [Rhizobium leguminosarum]TBG30011.1 hypothetical protein ELG75_37860 [Rhizobium leguminosarum]TBG50144.1 hypothetical protein ELG72_37275 [Rhizobium leguminosarum]